MKRSTQLWLPLARGSEAPKRSAAGGLRHDPRNTGLVIEADPSEEISGVPKLLEFAGARVVRRQLPVADYLISHRVLVERKADGDFTRSLYDGRLFKQLRYLRRSSISSLLAVEGSPAFFERFWPPRLGSVLLSVAVDFRVPIMFTRKVEGTAGLLLSLARRYRPQPQGEHYEPVPTIRRRGRRALRLLDFRDRLLKVDGVGQALALRIMGHFGRLEAVLGADEKALGEVRGIGRGRAEAIFAALRYGPQGP